MWIWKRRKERMKVKENAQRIFDRRSEILEGFYQKMERGGVAGVTDWLGMKSGWWWVVDVRWCWVGLVWSLRRIVNCGGAWGWEWG